MSFQEELSNYTWLVGSLKEISTSELPFSNITSSATILEKVKDIEFDVKEFVSEQVYGLADFHKQKLVVDEG